MKALPIPYTFIIVGINLLIYKITKFTNGNFNSILFIMITYFIFIFLLFITMQNTDDKVAVKKLKIAILNSFKLKK